MKSILTAGLLVFLVSGALAQEEPYLLKSVYFGGGSYYIDGRQLQEIQEFIGAVPNLDNYHIAISSHTDNIGGAEYNQWLSEMRSRSVIQALGQMEIPEERIQIQDNGQKSPLYDNRTWGGKRANRRVDIVLTLVVF